MTVSNILKDLKKKKRLKLNKTNKTNEKKRKEYRLTFEMKIISFSLDVLIIDQRDAVTRNYQKRKSRGNG